MNDWAVGYGIPCAVLFRGAFVVGRAGFGDDVEGFSLHVSPPPPVSPPFLLRSLSLSFSSLTKSLARQATDAQYRVLRGRGQRMSRARAEKGGGFRWWPQSEILAALSLLQESRWCGHSSTEPTGWEDAGCGRPSGRISAPVKGRWRTLMDWGIEPRRAKQGKRVSKSWCNAGNLHVCPWLGLAAAFRSCGCNPVVDGR